MQRLLMWYLGRRYGGVGRSWLLSSALILGWQAVRRVTRPKPVVEVIPIGTGHRVIIDQLSISHRRQIRQEKARRRARRKGGPVDGESLAGTGMLGE